MVVVDWNLSHALGHGEREPATRGLVAEEHVANGIEERLILVESRCWDEGEAERGNRNELFYHNTIHIIIVLYISVVFETKLVEPLLNLGTTHEKLPQETRAIVLYHGRDGALVYGEIARQSFARSRCTAPRKAIRHTPCP